MESKAHLRSRPARAVSRRAALACAGTLHVAAALLGCEATRLSDTETFEEAVRTYRVSDEKKALALAADENGRRVWGAQYGSLDQERATDEAMEECQRSARRAGVQAQCYLFAVGDREPPATLEGCRAGRINPRRCAAQSRYGPELLP